MRRVQALFVVAAGALVVAAVSCDGGGGDTCEKDAFGECVGSPGGTGGGGGTGSGNGGGAGGGPACVVENCPQGNECQDRACVEGKCGFTAHEDGSACGVDGQLQCTGGACGCTAGEQCTSGFCADGVCCDTACDGACEACRKAITGNPNGNDGVCGPFASGVADPDTPECDDAGGCGLVPGYCACEDGQKGFTETDADCGGSCGATCKTGQKCSTKGDCESASSECVDGVCCNSSCTEACFSCVLPGREGLCLPFAGMDPGECGGAFSCSPAGACVKAAGQSCGAGPECASGLCKEGSCTECDDQNPCGEGRVCVEKACVASGQPQGTPCAGGAACESGFCVDGVCCDSICDGLCAACNTAYTQNDQGECYFVISGYDPQAECNGPKNAGVCNGNGQCGIN